MALLRLILTFAIACLAIPVSAAKPKLVPAVCQNLLIAMDMDDLDYGDVALPARIETDFGRKDLSLFFRYDLRAFRDGVDRKRLRELVGKISTLDADELKEFSQMRALFKKLRFSFALYDQDHTYPDFLDTVTTELGKLRDANKNRQAELVAAKSAEVTELLKKENWAKLDREIDKFTLSSGRSLRRHLHDLMIDLDERAKRPNVTGKQFHEMRKIVSRLVAFVATVKTVYPSPGRQRLFEYLSTVSSRMGLLNDDLLTQKFAGTFDYEAQPFAIPKVIRDPLKTLVAGWPPP